MSITRRIAYWGTSVGMLGGVTEEGFPRASLFLSVENLPVLTLRVISREKLDLAVEHKNGVLRESEELDEEGMYVREWQVLPSRVGSIKIGDKEVSWFDVESRDKYKVGDFEGHVMLVEGKNCYEYIAEGDEEGERVLELKEKLVGLRRRVWKVLSGEGWSKERISGHIKYVMTSMYELEVDDPKSVEEECGEIREYQAELLSFFGAKPPSH